MRRLAKTLIAFSCIVALPAAAYAQASITGVVKDTSGGVMPGVTVEASSDVLIEKVRSAVTDGTGQYRIVDLRPGIYTVTFTLTGFTTVTQGGVELTGSFTASINAEMKVGGIAETVVVTTETPIVDIQSSRRQTTIRGEIVNAIPSARSYAGIVVLIPAIITGSGTASDIQVVPGLIVFGGSGGRGNEGRVQVDGVNVGTSFNGAGTSGYLVDMTNSEEVALTSSGGLGEAEVGGPTMSVVPKTGGNTFKGTLTAAGFGNGMVGSNYSQRLKDAGLTAPSDILKLWDYGAGVGGPIRKDRVWFFGNYRDEGSYNRIPNLFANAPFDSITAPIANAAAAWKYTPDTTRQAVSATSWTVTSLRLTLQATRRNKINLFWDEQRPCMGATWTPQGEGCRHPTDTEVYSAAPSTVISPEASGYGHRFTRVQQATWTSPATNQLLLEAGVGTSLARWGQNRRPDSVTRDLVRVTELCTAGCPANGSITGLQYRSENPEEHWSGAQTWRASASFVTGAHSMKFGYQGAYHADDRKNFPNSTSTTYFFENGVPSQIAEVLIPFDQHLRVRYDAVYAQEQWTVGRATLQGAVRYDHAWSYFPDQQVGPVRFLPTPVVFARDNPDFATPSTALCGAVPAGFTGQCINNVTGYHDLTPRLGLAYDLFGTGKTSVKVSLGKYLEAASNNNGNYSAGNPVNRMPTGGIGGTGVAAVTRTWTDANGNYIPDCELENSALQNNIASGGDFCGNLSNQNFGKPVFTNSFDARLMGGWGVRPSDWVFGVSVQQQILPRTSVEIGYNRRWLQHFTVTDNILQASSDFTQFSIVAPLDPRLPGGGGYTVGNLYNVNPLINGLPNTQSINNFATDAANYGDQYQRFNGVLVNLSARVRNGLTFQGGINVGKTVSDNCELRPSIPELMVVAAGTTAATPQISPTNPYCHFDSGVVWRATSLGAYVIPRINVEVSGTFRSDQGGWLAATYGVTSAIANQGPQPLGRNLSNNAPSVLVNLITPGTLSGDRVNELDFKIAKILKVGRTRTNVGVEIYNALNSDAVLTYSQTFNASWLQPTQVLTARFVKISARVDF